MARARNIKPGFFKNEDLGTADPYVSLLFAGLWTLADKAGILEDRPLRIRAELFPYRENFDVNGYLTVLVSFKLIHRYEVEGVRYIEVANFKKHQTPHHTEKASEYPSYSDSCKITVKPPLINGATPSDSLIPDSLIPDSLIPESTPLPPHSENFPAENPIAPAKADAPKLQVVPADETEIQAASRETWAAYAEAYADRYGTKPVRNSKINGQVKQLVQRLGRAEAPPVAAFYVRHANAFYVRNGHDIGSLLAGCEKLRTEWATGRMVTVTSAQQADRTQSNANAAQEALRIIESRKATA
jgi:hypothetical protein